MDRERRREAVECGSGGGVGSAATAAAAASAGGEQARGCGGLSQRGRTGSTGFRAVVVPCSVCGARALVAPAAAAVAFLCPACWSLSAPPPPASPDVTAAAGGPSANSAPAQDTAPQTQTRAAQAPTPLLSGAPSSSSPPPPPPPSPPPPRAVSLDEISAFFPCVCGMTLQWPRATGYVDVSVACPGCRSAHNLFPQDFHPAILALAPAVAGAYAAPPVHPPAAAAVSPFTAQPLGALPAGAVHRRSELDGGVVYCQQYAAPAGPIDGVATTSVAAAAAASASGPIAVVPPLRRGLCDAATLKRPRDVAWLSAAGPPDLEERRIFWCLLNRVVDADSPSGGLFRAPCSLYPHLAFYPLDLFAMYRLSIGKTLHIRGDARVPSDLAFEPEESWSDEWEHLFREVLSPRYFAREWSAADESCGVPAELIDCVLSRKAKFMRCWRRFIAPMLKKYPRGFAELSQQDRGRLPAFFRCVCGHRHPWPLPNGLICRVCSKLPRCMKMRRMIRCTICGAFQHRSCARAWGLRKKGAPFDYFLCDICVPHAFRARRGMPLLHEEFPDLFYFELFSTWNFQRIPDRQNASVSNWSVHRGMEVYKGDVAPAISTAATLQQALLGFVVSPANNAVIPETRSPAGPPPPERLQDAPREPLVIEDISGGLERFPVRAVNSIDGQHPLRLDGEFGEVKYIVDYEFHQSVPLSTLQEPETAIGCSCADSCGPECSCGGVLIAPPGDDERSGGEPASRPLGCPYDIDGLLRREYVHGATEGPAALPSPSPSVTIVRECCAGCSCSPVTCANRVVQRFGPSVNVHLEVFRTRTKGWAVRTLEPIRAGRFLFCYLGRVFNGAEALRRGMWWDNEFGSSYQMDLAVPLGLEVPAQLTHALTEAGVLVASSDREITSAALEWTIDAGIERNVAAFANHSCIPNMHKQDVFVSGSGDPRLYLCAFFAARNIDQGEELTYDYGYSVGASLGQRIACRCGAEECRGWLV